MELLKEKREHFLYCLFCLKEIFYLLYFIRCIVYWIHFYNIHTFTYQKNLHTLFCLFLKSPKAFSVRLRFGTIYFSGEIILLINSSMYNVFKWPAHFKLCLIILGHFILKGWKYYYPTKHDGVPTSVRHLYDVVDVV